MIIFQEVGLVHHKTVLLILFIGYNDGIDDLMWPEKEVVFSLFEAKNGDLLHRFYWTINTAIDPFDLYGMNIETT